MQALARGKGIRARTHGRSIQGMEGKEHGQHKDRKNEDRGGERRLQNPAVCHAGRHSRKPEETQTNTRRLPPNTVQ